MAYRNLINQVCVDKPEFFCRMRDFICKRNGTYDYSTTGIGWTLHDESYATDEDNPAINDWFVIKSVGESGDEDLYFKVTFKNGDLVFAGYLYWNNATHVGVNNYNGNDNLVILETGDYILFVYGSLDFINVWETDNAVTYDYMAYFGKLTNLIYDDTVATSSAALTAGSDVPITVDAVPADWAVDKKVYIRGNADIELVTIKTLSGNDITADLINSYTAGAKLQMDVGYVCNSSATNMVGMSMVDRTGNAIGTPSAIAALFAANSDPDLLYDDYLGLPFHIIEADGCYGQLPNMFNVAQGSLTIGDTLVASGGDIYRYMKYYTSTYMLILEV